MQAETVAQLWVFWQSDRNVEGSLRNGSGQSHASLAGSQQPRAGAGPASGTSDATGSCYSRCLLYQLRQGHDPRPRKWKLGEVKALALQNSLLGRTRSAVTDGDDSDGGGALVKSMDARAALLAGCVAFGPLASPFWPQFLNL